MQLLASLAELKQAVFAVKLLLESVEGAGALRHFSSLLRVLTKPNDISDSGYDIVFVYRFEDRSK
jgi:hypothetical protein